jgi:hypothetical protein
MSKRNVVKVFSAIDKFNRAIDEHFLEIKKDAAEEWRQGIIGLMKEPKHGKEYKRPGGGRYTASAPGEAPAIRTGDLAESYEVRVHFKSQKVMIGTPLRYGFFLERGTRKMAKRPHIRPGFTAARPEIERKLGRPIRDNDFIIPGGIPGARNRRR